MWPSCRARSRTRFRFHTHRRAPRFVHTGCNEGACAGTDMTRRGIRIACHGCGPPVLCTGNRGTGREGLFLRNEPEAYQRSPCCAFLSLSFAPALAPGDDLALPDDLEGPHTVVVRTGHPHLLVVGHR